MWPNLLSTCFYYLKRCSQWVSLFLFFFLSSYFIIFRFSKATNGLCNHSFVSIQDNCHIVLVTVSNVHSLGFSILLKHWKVIITLFRAFLTSLLISSPLWSPISQFNWTKAKCANQSMLLFLLWVKAESRLCQHSSLGQFRSPLADTFLKKIWRWVVFGDFCFTHLTHCTRRKIANVCQTFNKVMTRKISMN